MTGHWLRQLPEAGGKVLDTARDIERVVAEIQAHKRAIADLEALQARYEAEAERLARANWSATEIAGAKRYA